jgi:hypothetical protein
MATADFSSKTILNRKARRDRQYASTLVHYLGVEKALEVCRENTWIEVRKAIVEQYGVAN